MGILPYHPISLDYKTRFQTKVYKVPVSIAEDCPNRRGLKGMVVCIFCDEWGSAAQKESLQLDLKTQIDTYLKDIKRKYNAEKFLVYFQAYTSTFLQLTKLQSHFETALSTDEVHGFVIGTRPDCLSPAVLQLWKTYAQRTFVAVEMGVQSFFEDQVAFLKRGHTARDSIEGINRIYRETGIDIGIHLMFGLPNETDERIIETALICNKLPISNVKLHNLHVLKNTPLEILYRAGEFTPVTREEYTRKVILFLEHLDPSIAIQRLNALASRWDELIAPDYTRHKMETFQFIIDEMARLQTHQGRCFISN